MKTMLTYETNEGELVGLLVFDEDSVDFTGEEDGYEDCDKVGSELTWVKENWMD